MSLKGEQLFIYCMSHKIIIIRPNYEATLLVSRPKAVTVSQARCVLNFGCVWLEGGGGGGGGGSSVDSVVTAATTGQRFDRSFACAV